MWATAHVDVKSGSNIFGMAMKYITQIQELNPILKGSDFTDVKVVEGKAGCNRSRVQRFRVQRFRVQRLMINRKWELEKSYAFIGSKFTVPGYFA